MPSNLSGRPIRSWIFYGCLFLAVPVALAFVRNYKADQVRGALNYQIAYNSPTEWRTLPHGPQAIFLFRDPKSHILIRGAVNRVLDELNPTPELDSDHLAVYYVGTTKENMADWKADTLGTVPAGGATFRLIRRERKGKAVVTAFAVRGNTTVLVSMSGNGSEAHQVDLEEPDFARFLGTFRFSLPSSRN